ncbi:hypothetical protein RHMOL_Rhmol08G0184200 [Rhododendron molle]|uniref:Uncharacterized protein n=1 Tax=Rhododendron molle TaxID=49168 RepID=A0ACC0MPY3_RHOML|nr:hypothetical protein RHMOL_Rhmol08G0184200 [Rhododendron molle]
MTSGGDGELPSRDEVAAATTTVVMEVDNSSAVTLVQEGVVGEGLAVVGGTGESPEAVESSGGVAAIGDAGDSEVVQGEDSGLATSSRCMPGGELEVSGSGGSATGTPHTPTVKELLVAVERADGERREGAGDEVMTAGRIVVTPMLRAAAAEPRVGTAGSVLCVQSHLRRGISWTPRDRRTYWTLLASMPGLQRR